MTWNGRAVENDSVGPSRRRWVVPGAGIGRLRDPSASGAALLLQPDSRWLRPFEFNRHKPRPGVVHSIMLGGQTRRVALLPVEGTLTFPLEASAPGVLDLEVALLELFPTPLSSPRLRLEVSMRPDGSMQRCRCVRTT